MMAQSQLKIRTDLDFIPILHDDRRMILIRDNIGLVPEGLALPQELFEFIALLDGSRDIRDIQTEPSHTTLIVAGVDFSHIGLKFGHSVAAGSLEDSASSHDRTLLERLEQADADGFWGEMLRVEDRFHVCGFPALACLLEILPPSTATILDYGIYRENATGSAVTFAAAAFTAGVLRETGSETEKVRR
jgi:hypothetical protein